LYRVSPEVTAQGHGMIAPGGPGNPWHEVHTSEIRKSFRDAGFLDCFPLYSILLAINVTTVDYFSLDVEMAEYKILRNIPFQNVTIKAIISYCVNFNTGSLYAESINPVVFLRG